MKAKPVSLLASEFRSKGAAGAEGEMARAVSFFEPAFEVECAGVTLELKADVCARRHHLLACEPDQLIESDSKSRIAEAEPAVAFAAITHRELEFGFIRSEFD